MENSTAKPQSPEGSGAHTGIAHFDALTLLAVEPAGGAA